MRNMRHIGRAVLLGICMLWGPIALGENPKPSENLNCIRDCTKTREACINACKEDLQKWFSSCAMAAGMRNVSCREKCERIASDKK